MHGAYRCALAASCTLVVVDNCEVVFNLDSARGAFLLTFAATDTAVCTSLACYCALVVIGAENLYSLGVGNHTDNAVRTNARAHSATDTEATVHSCHAVHDANCLLRTNACAVAKAEAGVVTHFLTVIAHISYFTALNTDVFKLLL